MCRNSNTKQQLLFYLDFVTILALFLQQFWCDNDNVLFFFGENNVSLLPQRSVAFPTYGEKVVNVSLTLKYSIYLNLMTKQHWSDIAVLYLS